MHIKSRRAGRLVDKGTQRRPSLTNGRGMCELTLNTDEILLIWRSSSPITSLFSPLHETNCRPKIHGFSLRQLQTDMTEIWRERDMPAGSRVELIALL